MPDEYYDNEPRVTSTPTDNLWTQADDESLRCPRCKRGKLQARVKEDWNG